MDKIILWNWQNNAIVNLYIEKDIAKNAARGGCYVQF